MALVIVSTSAAASQLASENPRVGPWLLLVPVILGAIDIAFAPAARARAHALLGAKYLDVLSDLGSDPSIADCEVARTRTYQIASEEPPLFEALYAVAVNQTTHDMELRDPEEKRRRVAVTRWQRITKNIFRYTSAANLELKEVNQKKPSAS